MEVDKLTEGADIVRFIKAQRIKWLGHVQRLDLARQTRKLLDWKPMGIRAVGRPRYRWQEDVMGDLKKLKVKNWKERAKDRRTWRDLKLERVCSQTQLCQLRCLITILDKYMFRPLLAIFRFCLRELKVLLLSSLKGNLKMASSGRNM